MSQRGRVEGSEVPTTVSIGCGFFSRGIPIPQIEDLSPLAQRSGRDQFEEAETPRVNVVGRDWLTY